MNQREKQVIDQVTTGLAKVLQGKEAETIELKNCPVSLEKLVKCFNDIVYSYSEIWNFIQPLSQGMLNIEPPRVRNIIASPFKELHSQLRTLVWQVQQIAQGDYR